VAALNKVMLIGNLGRDPEIRYTQDGASVANFSIATTEKWKGKDGQQQESTEWHNIVAWNKLADVCKNYLFKGSQVFIEGKIKTRTWTDREGNQKKAIDIIASNMVMLGSRGSRSDQSENRSNNTSSSSSDDEDFGGITDSDIPF
jgi:single-strand DNA-binding protein